MVSLVRRRILIATVTTSFLLLASGCSSISVDDNQRALDVIEPIALRDSKVVNATGTVECGEPRDHLLTEEGYPTTFRTICRVYFDDGEQKNRYKDMICIGDFETKAITEGCYVWAPYYPNGVPPE
jgi:hypothetical protein